MSESDIYKDKNPEISIIVPIYNAEKYLSKCIESILNQTFNNFELLLIDDGSNDKSGYICDEFAKKDSRIRVFHNENMGVSATRNYGINISKGKYLMFCDSDDYVSNIWCEELYKIILLNPNAWICCNLFTVDYNTNEKRIVENNLDEINYLEKNDYYIAFDIGISAYCYNKIFLKEIINKFNIRFNENSDLGEDIEFGIEYLRVCDSIIILNKYLYYYVNQHQETLSTKKYVNYFDLLRNFFRLRKPFIKECYLGEFYSNYFYCFSKALMDRMNLDNGDRLIDRLRYNQKCINTKEFIECLDNVVHNKEDERYKKLLKTRNYYVVYLYQKISNFIKLILHR